MTTCEPLSVRRARWTFLVALLVLPSALSAQAFVAIGDYGQDSSQEAEVADLVNQTLRALSPSREDFFVITLGDNNYTLNGQDPGWQQEMTAYSQSTCQGADGTPYYRSWFPGGQCPDAASISQTLPARGSACVDYSGAPMTLSNVSFYPLPGNEDDYDAYRGFFPWARQGCAATPCDAEVESWVRGFYPSWSDFTCDLVPQTAYDVRRGDYHVFLLDTHTLINSTCGQTATYPTPAACGARDFGGMSSSDRATQEQICAQGFWLQYAAGASDAPFRIAALHHSPYSAGNHGSCPRVQYDFAGWGIQSVLSGHTHVFQSVDVTDDSVDRNSLHYMINGSSGTALDNNVCDPNYTVGEPPPYRSFGSKVTTITGYNKQQSTQSKNGYGALYVYPSEAEVMSTRFYDHRSTGLEDYVYGCEVESKPVGSYPPFKSRPCTMGTEQSYYMQCCDPQTSTVMECSTN